MSQPSYPKTRILAVLQTGESLTIHELIVRLPELSWRELFRTVRTLSRQGAIQLRRQGYDFLVSSLPTHSRS